jgi:hypothetical protein
MVAQPCVPLGDLSYLLLVASTIGPQTALAPEWPTRTT